MKVNYDGKGPNYCSGNLSIEIDGKLWKFPEYCLYSHGKCYVSRDDAEVITKGNWEITYWPDNFPEDLKPAAEEAVNAQIRQGCCGGCI